jgi:hypothetical protein
MSFCVAMTKAPSRKAPSPDAPMGSITPYGLRMPRELKEALETAAHENGRSLNSEIVARLEATVRMPDPSSGLAFAQTAKSSAPKIAPVTVDLEARISALETALVALTANAAKAQN